MKVIITGGAGFIGSHAVRHFVECGDEVLNIDKLTYASNKNNVRISNFLQADVCNTTLLKQTLVDFNPDVVVHFAAETHVDNSIDNCHEFIESNVKGTASVLDACKHANIKLCHISTDEVYGPASNRAFLEDDSLAPMNPYAATKAAAEMLVRSYKNTYGTDFLIIRPSNNYGPQQHHEKFIPKLLHALSQGKHFPLYGSGTQEREWTYVEDTVKVIRKLLLTPKWNETYNLSSNVTSTNIETAKKVVEFYNRITGSNIDINDVVRSSIDRPGHDKKYWISSEKIRSHVHHEYHEFHQGLEKTVLDYVK